ncbi:MAG: hypothetical protein MUP03_02300, partial [Anaerolineales bacterium]|nr:hypothetical protein [Anaerolineales bacterium]
ALKYWTLHGAINCDGWNILKVTANGSDITFWINGTLVWEGTNPDLSSGRVGIGMFRDNATGNRLRVDWAKLTPAVAISDEWDVLVPGVEVVGGNVNMSPRVGLGEFP